MLVFPSCHPKTSRFRVMCALAESSRQTAYYPNSITLFNCFTFYYGIISTIVEIEKNEIRLSSKVRERRSAVCTIEPEVINSVADRFLLLLLPNISDYSAHKLVAEPAVSLLCHPRTPVCGISCQVQPIPSATFAFASATRTGHSCPDWLFRT